jgi:dihydrofolate reductase
MGRIVVSQFVSVDGVMEDPGGSEGWDRGGWALKIDRGEEGNKFKLDEVMESEALLLGRVTYEGFAEAWPSREGDFADKFNNMPKFVVSTTMDEAEWNNSTLIKSDVPDALSKLKQEQDGDILVNGSGQLVETLMEHGLVDEYRLMVFPIILASGMRLFDETDDATILELVGTQQFDNGIVNLTYRPAQTAERS